MASGLHPIKREKLDVVERSCGSFVRTVLFPVDVDESKATAAFKNGLLTVTLPLPGG